VVQILLFYNQLQSNTFYEPKKIQLFPLDRQWLKQIENQGWNSRTIPIFTMFSQDLISSLLRQYFFISLYRAFGESLASENASRLASMQVAEKNIEERLGEFRHQFQHKRQSEITEELLEIISAFEVENTY
jgi:F-type H+-transporting ATPase subunit gamma